MPVHAESVVSTAINVFRPDIYTKLTTMENLCYTSPVTPSPLTSTDSINFFKTKFTELSNALVTWMNIDRESMMLDFIPVAYGYNTMVQMFGISNSIQASLDSRSIFTCNGYLNTLLGYTDAYYNDIVVDVSTPTHPRIDADLAIIAAVGSTEVSAVNSLISQCRSMTSKQISKMLFEDVPLVGTTSKASMATLFFTTLHYSEVYSGLNVGDLTQPPLS